MYIFLSVWVFLIYYKTQHAYIVLWKSLQQTNFITFCLNKDKLLPMSFLMFVLNILYSGLSGLKK